MLRALCARNCFITIVVKSPHLWGGYKTAIHRIAIDQ